MTIISQAYDALYGVLAATFPNHKELVNPLVPDIGDELTLAASYGVVVNGGLNTNREQNCRLTMERDLTVVMTRKIMRGDQARSAESMTEYHDTVKQILEDQFLLIQATEGNATLQNLSNDLEIVKCVYEQDAGIEPLKADSHQFVMMRSVFKLEYFESINP